MIRNVFIFYCLAVLLASCATGYEQFVTNYNFKSGKGTPDYSNLDYWAAHPDKKDPSDSRPRSLQGSYKADTLADVFFLYPTSYGDRDHALGYNAPIDNAAINAKTDYTSILNQASIFNAAGRVFAPRYRQADYWCYFMEDTVTANAAFDLAYNDIKAAFEYYMANYNHGKPIIIAAHSQGSTHALRLLKELFDGKPLQKQLIAAYTTGMPVDPNLFSNIKKCDSPDETGCICSWRSLKTGYTPGYIKKEKYTAIVTNPLTWTTSEPDAPRSANRGSVLRNFSKLKKHVTSASVHGGMLWCRKPKFFGSIFLRLKNYHIADYNFFYLSVRENAVKRRDAFLKQDKNISP